MLLHLFIILHKLQWFFEWFLLFSKSNTQKQLTEMLKRCSLNVCKIHRKTSEWCVFLWTLRSFEEHPFYKAPPDDYFWTLTIFEKKNIENEHIFQAWGIFKYFQNTCTKESEHSLKLSFSSSQYSDFLCFCNKWKIIDRYQLLWFVKNKCEAIILLI